MSEAQSQVRIPRKVKYIGKDPTRVRAFLNGPKIDVQPGQTIEVEEVQAKILRGIPTLWEEEGVPAKFDKHEEARLQEHQQDMKNLASAQAGDSSNASGTGEGE
jgi:hypothetical protein